jgi:hypothetical protein
MDLYPGVQQLRSDECEERVHKHEHVRMKLTNSPLSTADGGVRSGDAELGGVFISISDTLILQ